MNSQRNVSRTKDRESSMELEKQRFLDFIEDYLHGKKNGSSDPSKFLGDSLYIWDLSTIIKAHNRVLGTLIKNGSVIPPSSLLKRSSRLLECIFELHHSRLLEEFNSTKTELESLRKYIEEMEYTSKLMARQNLALSYFYDASRLLSRSLDHEIVIKAIVNMVSELFPECFCVLVVAEASSILKIITFCDQTTKEFVEYFNNKLKMKTGEGCEGHSITDKLPWLIRDINQDTDYEAFRNLAKIQKFTSVLAIPLILQDRALGSLVLYSEEKSHFYDDEIKLLVIFGEQAAQATENAHLFEETGDKLRRTKERLLQSEKLNLLGNLISGIAHELNNPLTGILGFSELLLKAEMSKDDQKLVEFIHKEGWRCKGIIEDFLSFARKSEPSWEYVSINDIINKAISLWKYQTKKKRIEIILRLDKDLPPTLGLPQRLQQAFLNILVNAYQAMEDSGKKMKIMVSSACRDEVIHIRFKDNGLGISPENLDKIFEPFFTTKDSGKGTGLGLSLVYGIIDEHGGKISVKSKPGKGALFLIDLPIKEMEL